MAEKWLEPGDTLKIRWESTQDTPAGQKPVKLQFDYSYEEVIELLASSKQLRIRQSEREGARFSKHVGLSLSALVKGVWSSGSAIDRVKILDSLISHFHRLTEQDYLFVSQKAKDSLKDIAELEHTKALGRNEDFQHIVTLLH